MIAVVALAGLVLGSACAPAAAPAPTAAPAKPAAQPTRAAEPTKAAAPTKAPEPTEAAVPTAAPTSAPAKKVNFPDGKPITIIVTFAAGSPTDITARVLAGPLEKELKAPVQVVNKPGASGQVGTTEIVKAKPDGYTLGTASFLSTVVTYLDAEKKAGYTRADFQPVAHYATDLQTVAVKADSPYKTAKDLIEAAKANPGKIKAGTAGPMTNTHFGYLSIEQVTGAKFNYVHFDGGGPATTAMLGGHIDAVWNSVSGILPMVKSGDVRVVGIPGKETSKYLPGVQTFEQQGYPVYTSLSNGLTGPAGVPREIVEILSKAVQRAVASDEYQTKMDQIGSTPHYMDTEEFAKYWTEQENRAKPLIEMAKKQMAQ